MNGKGSWRGTVFIERLWRSVKYEEVYLHGYETVSDSRIGICGYFDLYNQNRPHRVLGRSRLNECIFFSTVANPSCSNDGWNPLIELGLAVQTNGATSNRTTSRIRFSKVSGDPPVTSDLAYRLLRLLMWCGLEKYQQRVIDAVNEFV